MKSLLISVFLTTFLMNKLTKGLELGDLIPLCAANDPDLNKCVKESAQTLIPILSRGVPLLKIPPLDPMHSPEINLSEDDHNIKIDVAFTNVIQVGLSKTVVDEVLVDLKGGLMVFNSTFPHFSFVGDYKANGHVLNFQMTGDGKANITIQNAKCHFVIKFHVENDRIVEDNVEFNYNFDQIFLDYDHLTFNGDEELGKTSAAFINDNAVEIMNGFKPSLNRYYSGIIREYLKGFFSALPYSSLFKNA